MPKIEEGLDTYHEKIRFWKQNAPPPKIFFGNFELGKNNFLKKKILIFLPRPLMGVVWNFLELPGSIRYYLELPGIIRYYLELPGIIWYYPVLPGIFWNSDESTHIRDTFPLLYIIMFIKNAFIFSWLAWDWV